MGPAAKIRKTGQREVPAHRAAHGAPDTPSREESHPLSVGEAVAIFALNGAGRVYLEGQAAIIARGAQPHIYHVQFQGEKRSHSRFVNPDWQIRPDRSLALLIEFFRANRITNPSVADFFPEDR